MRVRQLLASIALVVLSTPAQARFEGGQNLTLAQARAVTLSLLNTSQSIYCGRAAESHIDIVAFPSRRSDRVYTSSMGIGRVYQLHGQTAKMVWCGKETFTSQEEWRYANPKPGILFSDYGTEWGKLPALRGGMDEFVQVGYGLNSIRLNANGNSICSKTYSLGASAFAQPGYAVVNYSCP